MLAKRIPIWSREIAEAHMRKDFPSYAAVISFYDPQATRHTCDYKPLDYTGVCDCVFYAAVHDIDINVLEDFGLTYLTYFPEADALAEFIIQAKKEGRKIICQCEYGQSRSAACAAAIKEYFDHSGIEVFGDYRYYPNQLIFNKLLQALKRTGRQ